MTMEHVEPGTLYLVGTPIGNLEDISLRAMRVLGSVDVLACEDTRYTRRIFERYNLSRPRTVFSYHEHNEDKAGRRIIECLRGGRSVAVCSNGGLPGISDPGYRIVSQCRELGMRLEIVPGPSAAPTALVVSGLPVSSYTFKGFPPRKSGARRRFLGLDRDLPHTLVFFESPYRLGAFLEDAWAVLGNRNAAVCIELTKKFEAVHRGRLEDLAAQFRDAKGKGEVTVVIAGLNPRLAKRAAETREVR